MMAAAYCSAAGCVEVSTGYVRLALVDEPIQLCDQHLEPIRGALFMVLRPAPELILYESAPSPSYTDAVRTAWRRVFGRQGPT
jgi:hypothetical protein